MEEDYAQRTRKILDPIHNRFIFYNLTEDDKETLIRAMMIIEYQEYKIDQMIKERLQ